ncbi:MAG: chorismate synthase [Ruminococcaceae bacterium]|nr:chorismate synthase [Oscillospiraceae bacterium]
MKNTYGTSLAVTIFGESHGDYIGAVIDGLAPGIKIDREYIDKKLLLRRPFGSISTARVEQDDYSIVSGVFEGYTTGTPITILIKNENTKSKDYSKQKDLPRPSHADFSANCKYHGFQDYRGGGHFSGRVTAALVAAGAIIESALEKSGIKIGTHISKLHGIKDRDFSDYAADIEYLSKKKFPVLSEESEARMTQEIKSAHTAGDSVGGVLESVIIGVPEGVGEPWFDSAESMISHILFSIGGIKGIEFGDGFALADMLGSEANDPITVQGGKIVTKTNRNGGINGGITNGMPLTVRCAVKPTPSIYKEQDTVSLSEKTDKKLTIQGRHDPAIIHRVRAVVDAALAIAIADMLTLRFGTDFLAKSKQ